MSQNEKPTKLPSVITVFREESKIVEINKEHTTVKAMIENALQDDSYNSIVTMENYDAMKSSSQELSKTAKFISNFRIAKKKDEMKHIDEFEVNLKGYCNLITNKQEEIKKGLDVFDEQKRATILTNCIEYLNSYYDEVGLREEFRTIALDDMTLSKYATAKLVISKAGKEEVEKRVNEKLTLQTKVDNRILQLENECYKQGIEPLTVEHIQGFLYEDDATYNNRLQSLIDAEKIRNEKVKEQEKVKAESEAKQKLIDEQKALKDELHARYEGQIRTADLGTLVRINLELKSYDEVATYELKQQCIKRQQDLEQPKAKSIDTSSQEEHLKAIQDEVVEDKKEVPSDGKVSKTLSIKIRVPAVATDEQVIGAVINMIKADRFPLENIEVN